MSNTKIGLSLRCCRYLTNFFLTRDKAQQMIERIEDVDNRVKLFSDVIIGHILME